MEVRHRFKMWERKWGYLRFNKKDIEKLFHAVKDRQFPLLVDDMELLERKIDRWGRIWVGKSPLSQFEVGSILVCSKDSSGKYRIKKE